MRLRERREQIGGESLIGRDALWSQKIFDLKTVQSGRDLASAKRSGM